MGSSLIKEDIMTVGMSLNQVGVSAFNQTHVNRAAFCVTTGLALGTMGSVYAVMSAAAVSAQVAYGLLSVAFAGASAGSIAAWMDPKSRDLQAYFENLHHHTGVAIAGMYQFAAQTMVQAVVQGVAQGISTSISRKIAGPDFVIRTENQPVLSRKKL